jgi:sugar (pentulose or hexulose) kinase
LLLGLDVGTTAVKAAVVDAAGVEVAHGRVATPWRGTELDPDELLAAAFEAAAMALGDRRVVGVGVASMAETGVLTDDALRPVVPSIAWHDTRGEEEATRIAAELPEFAARTGQPPTAMCTLAKYAWMRRHWPDAARGTRWFNVAEWIVLGFGGNARPEASLSSRTGFYDLHTGHAWDPALRWADAPASLAPPHAPAGTPLGHARASTFTTPGCGSERSRGLAGLEGAVLAVGGHDHAAAAVGAGAAGEGDVLDSCGTAEAILRATAPLDPETVRRAVADGFTVGRHALPGRFVLQGAFWSGEALQATVESLGGDRAALEAAALDVLAGRAGADADASGAGATGAHASGDRAAAGAAYLAALEAAGRTGADVLRRMDALAGARTRLVVTGGWSDGPAAREVKRRHLGPFEHVAEGFAGCRGAARAAFRGS